MFSWYLLVKEEEIVKCKKYVIDKVVDVMLDRIGLVNFISCVVKSGECVFLDVFNSLGFVYYL